VCRGVIPLLLLGVVVWVNGCTGTEPPPTPGQGARTDSRRPAADDADLEELKKFDEFGLLDDAPDDTDPDEFQWSTSLDERTVRQLLERIKDTTGFAADGPIGISIARIPEASGNSPQEKAIIAELKRRGGRVTHPLQEHSREPNPDAYCVDLPRTANDGDLELVASLPSVVRLYASSCYRVTSAGWSHLEQLEDLQRLDLFATDVKDADLVHLDKLKRLESLNLSYTLVTDEGLGHLHESANLRELRARDIRLGDDGLKHLGGLRKLESLELGWTGVTDAGLVYLKELPTLRKLDLSYTRVTDAGLERLDNFAALKHILLYGSDVTPRGVDRLRQALPEADVAFGNGFGGEEGRISDPAKVHPDERHVVDALSPSWADWLTDARGRILQLRSDHPRITDEHVALFGQLPYLERLELTGSRITDRGLEHLQELDHLRQLFVQGTDVTEQGIRKLQHALPRLKIYSSFSQREDFLAAVAYHNEVQRLEGTWKLVRQEKDGEQRPLDRDVQYSFGEGRLTITNSDGGKRECPFAIDVTKDPKRLNIEHTFYGISKNTECIYSVEDNRLTLSWGPVRPSEFVTRPGDGRRLWTFERADPSKNQ